MNLHQLYSHSINKLTFTHYFRSDTFECAVEEHQIEENEKAERKARHEVESVCTTGANVDAEYKAFKYGHN